jgi:hypothetical protein
MRPSMRPLVSRRDTDAGFGEPLVSVTAGQTAYLHVDTPVEPGATYVYGVAAQDCTPQLSSVVSSAPVTIELLSP